MQNAKNSAGCVVAETYGAWGDEAVEAFSQLASQLATVTCRPKLAVLRDIYGRLNLHLVNINYRLCLILYPCMCMYCKNQRHISNHNNDIIDGYL